VFVDRSSAIAMVLASGLIANSRAFGPMLSVETRRVSRVDTSQRNRPSDGASDNDGHGNASTLPARAKTRPLIEQGRGPTRLSTFPEASSHRVTVDRDPGVSVATAALFPSAENSIAAGSSIPAAGS